MKRFLSAVALCSSLLIAGSFVLVRTSRAKEDLIQVLIDLPAPPPPNPLSPPSRGTRPPEFFDKKNPPKDDAPIEDLLDYWRSRDFYRGSSATISHTIRPSERVLDRILAEVQKDPQMAPQYFGAFTGSTRAAGVVKEIYDASVASGSESDSLRSWLKLNSPYFADELEKASGRIADTPDYLSNQEELLALGTHDWDRARPFVDKLYSNREQPTSQVLARWVLYRRAMMDGSVGDVDRYRDELKAIVENKEALPGQRDLAMDALFQEDEWSGRDDWYFSLFADETLGNLNDTGRNYTGLTTLILKSPEGKYADKMIELSRSTNFAVRSAAVRNLALMLSPERPEVVRAMLPLLENPKWVKDADNARGKIVEALQKIKMPESVPALLSALDEKATREMPNYGVTNTNTTANWYPSSSVIANMAVMSNSATNTGYAMTTNSNIGGAFATVTTVVYPLRDGAISALGMQGDMRAGPPLRRVFSQIQAYRRPAVVEAMLKCNAFTIDEQVEALEAKAAIIITQAEKYRDSSAANVANAAPHVDGEGDDDDHEDEEVEGRGHGHSANVSGSPVFEDIYSMDSLLGWAVMGQTEATDDLVRAVIKRIEAISKSDPALAEMMRDAASNWQGPLMYSFLLHDLKVGKANAGLVLTLLKARARLRERQQPEVVDLRTGVPAAAGFSACLLESAPDYAAVFAGENVDAKKSMLACGRLIRARFPVATVAALLQHSDKQLVLAAERYLESEDSPEARRAVLSVHPNEARILGATTAFRGGAGSLNMVSSFAELFITVDSKYARVHDYGAGRLGAANDKLEKRLQKEVLGNADLLGIYAYDDSFVRIYKDKAVFSWEEDTSRYRERTLEPDEFERVKEYFAATNADGLPPFLSCDEYCEAEELIMLSRHGGRRVYFRTSKKPEFVTGLEAVIADLKRPPAKLRYWLDTNVPGFELVFADDNYPASGVWKNGGDLRVLVSDKARETEIRREVALAAAAAVEAADEEESETESESMAAPAPTPAPDRKYDSYSWHSLAAGRLGDVVMQPEAVGYVPMRDSVEPPVSAEQWKARIGSVEIRGSEDGLFKIVAGRVSKIGTGNYGDPVVTPNGRWALVQKWNDDYDVQLMRVNLVTGREYKVASAFAKSATPIAYVASIDRFLIDLGGGRHSEEEYDSSRSATADGSGTYFWLAPETGFAQPSRGELRPLGQQSYRPLQPAATALEFWAAIPNERKNQTVFGIYSTRTFAMKPLLTLPKIRFNSTAMWVDEAAGKVYFVYEGHVLAASYRQVAPQARN